MIKNIPSNFILCGLMGWCFECFWTGLHSLFRRKDRELTCNTSIWMFPIYGMAAFLTPISKLIKNHGVLFRGGVYAACIYTTEFITGTLLKKYKACPWDYSKVKMNYHGVIRWDYAPVWAIMGLIYEKILKR